MKTERLKRDKRERQTPGQNDVMCLKTWHTWTLIGPFWSRCWDSAESRLSVPDNWYRRSRTSAQTDRESGTNGQNIPHGSRTGPSVSSLAQPRWRPSFDPHFRWSVLPRFEWSKRESAGCIRMRFCATDKLSAMEVWCHRWHLSPSCSLKRALTVRSDTSDWQTHDGVTSSRAKEMYQRSCSDIN